MSRAIKLDAGYQQEPSSDNVLVPLAIQSTIFWRITKQSKKNSLALTKQIEFFYVTPITPLLSLAFYSLSVFQGWTLKFWSTRYLGE